MPRNVNRPLGLLPFAIVDAPSLLGLTIATTARVKCVVWLAAHEMASSLPVRVEALVS
jgi:hypothetical protein